VDDYQSEQAVVPEALEGLIRGSAHGRLIGLSFFSGSMGLDLGLEQAGVDIRLACDSDPACRRTISANRPDIAILGDIWKYDSADIRKAAGLASTDDIDLVVGGPPCQAFSTAGARRGFHDGRGNVFLRFIDLIIDLAPRYAVLENVRGLLSAPLHHTPHAERSRGWDSGIEGTPGSALFYVVNQLRAAGYAVSFELYNAANFGVPQIRERVIIICHRGADSVPHLMPTHAERGGHGLPPWRKLREALADLDPKNPGPHVEFPEKRRHYYRMLKAGQNWRDLPEEVQETAMGRSYFAGGGRTGFYRRLDWDRPSCTLVTMPNMPATDICHPDEDRPLSITEYRRIQEVPDDWVVTGSIADQYRQLGNAVPIGLGRAVGVAIQQHMAGSPSDPPVGFQFSRYLGTDEQAWQLNVEKSLSRRLAVDAQLSIPAVGELVVG
jgi:DNA (cytosine-5)-methyltransferase 1